MYQSKIVDAVVETRILKDKNESIFEEMIEKANKTQSAKMFKFCDLLVREFKYMNKLQEEKILYEVGYREKMAELPPHGDPAQIFDELMSVKSLPNFDYLNEQEKVKRANSIGVFKVHKK